MVLGNSTWLDVILITCKTNRWCNDKSKIILEWFYDLHFDWHLRQGYDIVNSDDSGIFDICSLFGFINAVKLSLRVVRKGLQFFGLPCNSHTWMSSSLHQRSPMFPHGNEALSFVQVGNEIAYKVAILIMLGLVRAVTWMLENPANSRCVYLPCLEKLLTFKLLKSSRCNWWGPYCWGDVPVWCWPCFCWMFFNQLWVTHSFIFWVYHMVMYLYNKKRFCNSDRTNIIQTNTVWWWAISFFKPPVQPACGFFWQGG